MSSFTLEATRYQTPTPDRLEAGRVVMAISDGSIDAVEPAGTPEATALAERFGDHRVAADTEVLVPGFVDLHIHAPQWQQNGTALDLALDEWLFTYTFPLEARFADRTVAEAVYPDLVATLLAHGTTTAVYLSSVHEEATVVLAETCRDAGQRAFVGRVTMDHPEGTPEFYRDVSAAAGIEASRRSIDDIRGLDGGGDRVRPIITPRFSPACTDELLQGLGDLAAATGVPVQTHDSESDWAHAYSFERFGVSDTTALDRFGLLREHTLLAHSNHVTAADLERIASRGAAIAHCPISNAYFANAVLPIHDVLRSGARIGLGTDIGAGVRPGVFQQIHDAVTFSRIRHDGVDASIPAATRGVSGSAIDTIAGFWLATAGGAEALGQPVGLLEPGHRFDAVLFDTTTPGGVIRPLDLDDDTRRFEKLVRLSTTHDIAEVWVDGVSVHRR
ncbi:MAG: amidohydrolase family protein [Actinomycetota bacterium]